MGLAPVESVRTDASVSLGSSGALTAGTSSSIELGTSGIGAGGGSISQMSSVVTIQSRVDEFVGSFGSEMASDQNLRMLIGLMILNALLGKNDDEQLNRAAEAAGLAAVLDLFSRRTPIAMFSATNIIQMQHQSTLVMTNQAVQTITESGGAGGQGSPGTRLDVTG